MPRLLLLAATTGYQTRAFADAALRIGCEVVLATDRCHVLDNPWGDHAVPVRFEEPVASAEALAAAVHATGPVDALFALADRPTLLAALTAERLGLPYNSPASVEASGNKFLARERFRNAGLPVPDFRSWPLTSDPHLAAQATRFPCVLKPLGLSGSRGVIRANSEAEFVAAFGRIRALLESPELRRLRDERGRHLQVESYIEGREFALEGVLTGGSLQVLALFDKPDPLEGPFFEETLYVTPSREPETVQRALVEAVRRGIAALGLTHGPIHAEVRWTGQQPYLLEIAARPIGGLCARALRFAGGDGLEELLLRHALGAPVPSARLASPASGVMMIPIPREGLYHGAEGEEEARKVPGITDLVLTAKLGQQLVPLPEGASYLGFLFGEGPSPADVERALRSAHQCLRFAVTTALPVL